MAKSDTYDPKKKKKKKDDDEDNFDPGCGKCTKSQIIKAIAESSGLSKVDSKKALDSLIKMVTKSLKKGDKVVLVGYGSFNVVKRAARMGKNPRTGAAIKIPAKKVVKFKAGAELAKTVEK